MKVSKQIACIIVTFNRVSILQENLKFIQGQEINPDIILVVNNGSTDGTIAFLQTQESWIYAVNLPVNVGYGAGLAAGIDYARENWEIEYFWLMDDDSFPNSKVLSSLKSEVEGKRLDGILGVTGFRLERGIPRPIRQADQGISNADFVLVDNALLSASAVTQVGNFRTDLFMMCEDYEYCFRLRKYGLLVGVLNDPLMEVNRKHLGSQSNSKNLIWRGYYHSRNLMLILKDHFTLKGLINYFYRQGKYLIHSMFFGVNRWSRTKYRLIGIWDGIWGISGKTLDPLSLKRVSRN
ncbi:glycosyltransferase [Algoriphagus aquatilis]|uniref:Glycosyltransferase n=1 Tax=Algoriphagus aquatilis TaxID=490186 RepID=A0ABW0BRT9_9BACT